MYIIIIETTSHFDAYLILLYDINPMYQVSSFMIILVQHGKLFSTHVYDIMMTSGSNPNIKSMCLVGHLLAYFSVFVYNRKYVGSV